MMPTSSADRAEVRVFIVEDDPRTRETLREIIESEPGFVLAGHSATADDARARAPAAQPDVVIVDLALGSESGVDVIRHLRAALPHAELMAHTVFDDRDIVLRALKAGASSYLLKGCAPDDLCRAIRDVKAGGAPMTPRIARLVIRDLHEGAGPDPLSPRERQILRGIDRGLTYKELAAELAISVHTVHSHIKSIYERLEADGKRDALARARSRGLI